MSSAAMLPKRHLPTSVRATADEDESRLLMSPDDPEEAGEVASTPSSVPPAAASAATMNDFAFVKIVARVALSLLRKFWAFSSAGFLAIVLMYWLFGGIFAFLLVLLSATGKTAKAPTSFID